jgi:hypothetical protein
MLYCFMNMHKNSEYKIHLDIYSIYWMYSSRASYVSIVSGYGPDDRAIEIRSPEEAKEFSL